MKYYSKLYHRPAFLCMHCGEQALYEINKDRTQYVPFSKTDIINNEFICVECIQYSRLDEMFPPRDGDFDLGILE